MGGMGKHFSWLLRGLWSPGTSPPGGTAGVKIISTLWHFWFNQSLPQTPGPTRAFA